MELRSEIQKLALEYPSYGYRRISKQLQQDGYFANHKRVLRLMRLDNLLCLRKRGFIVTTDSDHGLPVYPNLVPELQVNGINQLWVADITYIRLRHEFIYLAVLLDVFSRRSVGWELGRRLDASLPLAALHRALELRRPEPGLVHHSDRGVQYASVVYTETLLRHGIRISMSRKGNPYDNAFAESFIKTLKYEEVYLNEYANLTEARERIGQFIEAVYNRKRLHSSLGYRSPETFETDQNLYHTAVCHT
jgi:transposase InsO family protein